MPTKRILISGASGQDGSYLAEHLLDEGCEVWGFIRRSSSMLPNRVAHLAQRGMIFLRGDLIDAASVRRAIETVEPDEIYHLGAQSHVGVSFETPAATFQATLLGTLHVLEAAREVVPNVKIYNACSSEIFGNTPGPLDEDSLVAPVSPYGAAKAASRNLCHQYRERGLWVSSGILFNHCSPRQAPEFLPAKVTRAAIAIARGEQTELVLGNMEAARDWGWAPDYVALMPRILRHSPQDLVVGTGEAMTVGAYVHRTFEALGLDQMAYLRREASDRPLEIHRLISWPARLAERLGGDAIPRISPADLTARMLIGCGWPVCAHCGAMPAACIEADAYACNRCCGHGFDGGLCRLLIADRAA